MRFPFVREIRAIFAGRDTPTVPSPQSHTAGAPLDTPVQLDGRIDPDTSPWLWLVKFVLVVPHVIILMLLWTAVTLLTIVAGLSILFTGRYPRSIFEFNVGVMRWTWRVSFYATGSFATDRYPPFSLSHDPTYPADLEIAYPDAPLSRGLVLVKWWLLAIPHLLIVAVFAGGWGFGWTGGWRILGGSGLILILSVVAAIMRAVQGGYPAQMFDLIMGLNRWCYRVGAYVALMTDSYPPFRLDTGGTDPGHLPAPPATPDTPGGRFVAPFGS